MHVHRDRECGSQHVSGDRCVPQGGTDRQGNRRDTCSDVSRDRCVPQGGTDRLTDQEKEGIPVQYAPRNRCVLTDQGKED